MVSSRLSAHGKANRRNVPTLQEQTNRYRCSGETIISSVAGKGVLPDTCMWIELLRNGTSPAAKILDQLLKTEAAVFTCGPVLYELLQGIRREKERRLVLDAMQGTEYVEMTRETWARAAESSGKLRAAGKNIPLSDILIATLGMEHQLAIYSEDAHFDLFSELQRYPHPSVAAGHSR